MMRWFGPSRLAPFYTLDIERVPVPPLCCARCAEPIGADDFGIVMEGTTNWDEARSGDAGQVER